MATAAECMDVAAMLLDRAGVAPEAWPVLRYWMKRAVVGRAMDTNESALIDRAVEVADYCFARARVTGAMTDNQTAGLMTTLAILGGAALGVAATLAYERMQIDALSANEYRGRLANATRDYERRGLRHVVRE